MPRSDQDIEAEGFPVGDLSYTEASRELDEIVRFFEQREVDVDQLVGRLERATAIVDELDRRLRRTRAQVEELVPRLAAVLASEGPDDTEPGDDTLDEEAEAELDDADELIEVIEEVFEESMVVETTEESLAPENPGLF